MLTDYKNKVFLPDARDVCPSCKGKDWRKVVYGTRKHLVCKGCGYVKEIRK